MRPQAQSTVLSGRCFRRAPSHRQKLWQAILILATLALAVAANAGTLACQSLFAEEAPILKPGSTATIVYSFSADNPDLFKDPLTRAEVQKAAGAKESKLRTEITDLQAKVTSLETPSFIHSLNPSKVTRDRQILLSTIAVKMTEMEQLEELVQTAAAQKTLSPLQQMRLSKMVFEESTKFRHTADENLRLAARLLALRRVVSVTSVNLPPTWRQRIVAIVKNNKVTTFLIATSLVSGVTTIYMTHTEKQVVTHKVETYLYPE